MKDRLLSKVYQWQESFNQPELKSTLLLRGFGLLKVPLILMVSPRVTSIDESRCVIKIPLNRITRNHLHSMYFGTLCIGADACAGLLAVYLMNLRETKLRFVFKDLKAEFLKRAEDDVTFACEDGATITQAIEQAQESGERVNITTHIVAHCPTKLDDKSVARFELTLSMKI